MEKQSGTDRRRFIMLPSALLPLLSNTALRIVLYAKMRQGFVDIGKMEHWELSLENIHREFSRHRGYSKNTVRNGIRELRALKLISFNRTHYLLNDDEYEKWFYKKGLPNSGKGRLPKSGRAGLPKSGNQQYSSNKRNSITVEGEIAPSEETISPAVKAPAQPLKGNRKISDAEFDKLFPVTAGYVAPPPKTLDQQFEDIFGPSEIKAPENNPTVSGITEPTPENLPPTNSVEPAQTTPPTDTERRPTD